MNVKLCTKPCQLKRNKFYLLNKKLTRWKKEFDIEKQNYFEQEKQSITCKECESLSFQIVQLKKVLERYEKGQLGLDDVLSHQRYSNDKSGLDYSKFHKSSSSKTIFVKASDQPIQEKVNKLHHVHHHPKKRNIRKKTYVPRYKSNFVPTWFYSGIVGHTPNICYVRNFSVANGYYMWIKKDTNYEDP